MLLCCGATVVMLALMPVWACDVGHWHACPTYETRTSMWVILPALLGLAVIALDKAVCNVVKKIACCPCTTLRRCVRLGCGNTQEI